MRSKTVSLLLFGAACGGSSPEATPEVVGTPLSGVAFLARPSGGAAIDVRDFLDGREGEVVAESVTDEEGRFTMDLGALSGTFLATARTSEGVAVSAVTDDVLVGEGSTIVLSPITRLAEAYLRHLLAIGFGMDESRVKARRLFHLHFGRIDHHRIAPEDVSGASDRIAMLTPPVLAGILLGGLEVLLEDLGAGSTSAALEALADDVESDGLFDGRADGEALSGLDGQTLRFRYAEAIWRFLASPRNASVFGAAELDDVLAEIEGSRSELFPSGVVEGDMEGPALSAFELVDESGSEVDPSRGIRGRARISLEFEDASGVAAVRVETAGGEVADVDPDAARFEASIDTGAYQDGQVGFTSIALDGVGNETRRDLVLLIDNTPPTLELDPIPVRASAVATLTGTISDAASGVDVLEAIVFGQPAIVLETTGGAFVVDVPIACNVAEDIVVVARDRAGNERREMVTAVCDDQAPAIQLVSSTFVQEGGLELALDPNGTVTYSATAASSLTLDDRTPLPVRLEKYFNRLDIQSPNLPVIRFLVDDPGVNAAPADDLEVAFRYLVDGVERRPFAVLSRPGAGEPYQIPMSYQVLGPELATEGPAALHRVEIAAMDPAGNRSLLRFDFHIELLSPPVWLTGCDAAAEVRNHTLAAGNFHTMYAANVETDVAGASFRYSLDLGIGTLAPAGGAVVEPTALVRTRVLELGEDKFQQASSHNFVVSSFEELGQYCPFNTAGVYLNQAGVNERTRIVDQTWACVQGRFPNEQIFPLAVTNDDVPHASSLVVTTGAGAAAPTSNTGYVLAPDAPFNLTVRMRDPVVQFQGAIYDWSQDPRPPAGYVATVANSNARYRMAPSLGFHHVGVDRWNVPNGGWAQERFFETRSYLRRVEIEAQADMISARHATLPHLRIDVQRDASCAAPVVYRSQL